ncbi:MAG TPA: hypothetical protein VH601_08490 [Bryobacteraceae bacterium]|jgi:hypothetical protein
MEPFENILERFFARLTGPLNLRFVLQPLMAILLGIRDGVHDAKAGKPPFLLDLFARPQNRKRQIQKALRSLLIPMLVAIILDGVVQYLLFGWVRIMGAVTIGVLIMGLPYVIARAVTNRVISWRNRTAVSTSVKTSE